MSVTSEIKLVLKQEGTKGLDDLSKKFNKVADSSRLANDKFQTITAELRKNEQQIVKSNKGLQDYSRAWRELANSLDRTSKEFKEATAEAAKFERQAAKASGKRVGGGAGALGAVASAGLLGPEAILGAGIGALFGQPVAGAAIGATVLKPITSATGGATEYAAELEKQRIALAGLTKDYGEYEQALATVEKLSQQFAIPQDIITRQFTKLSASVIGAGGDLEDAEKAFLGVAAGVRGTGGDLQDLDSALTATSQVFSKGKVSAEELRQQIGERLPGAFTLFAESLNMTPAELDKALEQGKVSLADFQQFSELLFDRFGDSAATIVNSPAAAGDRLQVALSKLSESVGKLLTPIGAAFQDVFTGIIKLITQATDALNKFFRVDLSGDVEKYQKSVDDINKKLETARGKEVGLLQRQLKTQQSFLEQAQRQRSLKGIAGALKDGEPTGLPSIDTTTDRADKAAKTQKTTSKELLELAELRYEAVQKEDDLTVALLDHKIRLQEIEEMNADANTKKLKTIQSQEKFEKDINKHVSDQEQKQDEANKAHQKFETLVSDTLLKTEELTEEEQKRIDIHKALVPVMEAGFAAIKLGTLSSEELLEIIRKLKKEMGGEKGESFFDDFSESFKEGVKDMGDLAGNLGSSLADAFRGAGDALTEFLTTGTTDFNEFARSVLTDLTNIFVQYAMFQSLKALLNPLGFGFADGGIMTKDGPMPLRKYAAGGIANSPQVAVYGEGSTPEAYVPLPDGRSIPVTMQNGGDMGNVVVNVDASGTSVQGDSSNANMLGEALGAAVQAELIRQKRPGGLLA